MRFVQRYQPAWQRHGMFEVWLRFDYNTAATSNLASPTAPKANQPSANRSVNTFNRIPHSLRPPPPSPGLRSNPEVSHAMPERPRLTVHGRCNRPSDFFLRKDSSSGGSNVQRLVTKMPRRS